MNTGQLLIHYRNFVYNLDHNKTAEDKLHHLTNWDGDNYLRNILTKELLRDNKVDVNSLNHVGITPLTQLNLTDEQVEMLLKYNADPNKKNEHGDAPLHICNSPRKVQLLISAGAKLTVSDYYGNHPAIHRIGHFCNSETLEELIKSGANVNSIDSYQHSPLHYTRDKDSQVLLIENGANLKYSYTYKHFNKKYSTINFIDLFNCRDLDPTYLLKFEDIFIKSQANQTIIFHNSFVKTLIDFGFDPNHKDINGRTPLFYNENTIDLLEHGADPTIKDKNGEMAYQFGGNNCVWTNRYKDLKKYTFIILAIKRMNAICSFQTLYRNRLMNPNHPFCIRKNEELFQQFRLNARF
jgi:ankyrin repeat protein